MSGTDSLRYTEILLNNERDETRARQIDAMSFEV